MTLKKLRSVGLMILVPGLLALLVKDMTQSSTPHFPVKILSGPFLVDISDEDRSNISYWFGDKIRCKNIKLANEDYYTSLSTGKIYEISGTVDIVQDDVIISNTCTVHINISPSVSLNEPVPLMHLHSGDNFVAISPEKPSNGNSISSTVIPNSITIMPEQCAAFDCHVIECKCK